MIPDYLENDFFQKKINNTIHYHINESVEVTTGKYQGRKCAVISIKQIKPEILFSLETGDTGELIAVRQEDIKRI